MMLLKNIALDPTRRFTLAAGDAIHHVLAELHGNEFALYFISEHAEAIQRAISKRLYECSEPVVLVAAQLDSNSEDDA